MAKQVGRKLIIKRGTTAIAGVRTKSLTIGNEPIDITTDDDSGFRTLLEDSAQSQIDMSVEGLTDDYVLLDIAMGESTFIDTYTVTFPSGAEVTGSFRFNSFEMGAEYNGAITFTAEIHSTGEYTYTPAA